MKKIERVPTKLPDEIRRLDLMFAPVIHVTDSVEMETGITVKVMKSTSRKQFICTARHLVLYFLSINPTNTLEDIASVLNKDHASVLHSRKTIEDWIDTDPKILDNVIRIANRIIKKSSDMEKTERSKLAEQGFDVLRSMYDHRKMMWKIMRYTKQGGWTRYGLTWHASLISANHNIDLLVDSYPHLYKKD